MCRRQVRPEPSTHRTTDELQALADLSHALFTEAETASIRNAIATFFTRFGFDTATLLTLPTHVSAISAVPPTHLAMVGNADILWAHRIALSARHLPILLRSLDNAFPFVLWQRERVSTGRVPIEPPAWLGLNREPNVGHCLVVPTVRKTLATEAFALTGPRTTADPDGWPHLVTGLQALQGHHDLQRSGAPQARIQLTGREAEITHWIAAGKSDWEIGKILEISPKTVNFHAENIKRKCGVSTRVQAIVRLVGSG